MPQPLILLTGATGYVGGRLLSRLESRGLRLRALARRPETLRAKSAPSTEIVEGDAGDPAALKVALAGVDVAFYLVHALAATGDFPAIELESAQRFAAAAQEAGVRRIVYLGGLGSGKDLSDHLRSRQAVGEALRSKAPEVLEFRASIVIGSGSSSFEMIRALVERLPVMVTPRWVRTRTQPIAIDDVLAYLERAINFEKSGHQIIEIGGQDKVSYGDLMVAYARARGKKRWMIPVPFITPRLSSLWLRLITPVYATVGRHLVLGLRNETVVEHPEEAKAFGIQTLGVDEAIRRALAFENRDSAETVWFEATSSNPKHPVQRKGLLSPRRDARTRIVQASPEACFAVIEELGGDRGWYYANGLWTFRGFLDLLVGGPGMRRGRRDPDHLRIGDVLDCWRVEAIEPHKLLRLSAEMRLPGRGQLVYELRETTSGTEVSQTAHFEPKGLLGLAYWYGIWPLHALVFSGLLREIGLRAEARSLQARRS